MVKIMKKLKSTHVLILMLFILFSLGCEKDKDIRTKYYGEYRFTVHMESWTILGTHLDTIYIINGGIRTGNQSQEIFINWKEGGYGSYPSLSEDGTFIGNYCKGKFVDVDSVIFSVTYLHKAVNTYYNVTGTRN
jgi:hypothetical protein